MIERRGNGIERYATLTASSDMHVHTETNAAPFVGSRSVCAIGAVFICSLGVPTASTETPITTRDLFPFFVLMENIIFFFLQVGECVFQKGTSPFDPLSSFCFAFAFSPFSPTHTLSCLVEA